MTVSFVIPVRNDAVRLARCLTSIRRNTASRLEIETIVADNGSVDDSRTVAAGSGARVLELPGLRVSAMRNRAAATASGALLAFVDADHELSPGWLDGALEVMGDPTVGAAGALYTPPPDGTWVQKMYGALRGRTTEQSETRWLGSGNLVVRHEAFAAVAGFDESLEACEDVDLCQRLRAAGWRLVADPRMDSVHLGDPDTLGAVFRAERWRGRNNLAVTLRGPLSPRDVPGLVLPVLQLGLILGGLAGLVVWPLAGRWAIWLAVACVAMLATLPLLRTARMALSGRLRRPVDLGRAYLVAAVYELARALALITRASHHRRIPPTPAAPERSR